MDGDSGKRDREIARLQRELEALRWRIKMDEAIPTERRREIAGKELTDSLLQELAAYCRRDCDKFQRLRRQLRRLNR